MVGKVAVSGLDILPRIAERIIILPPQGQFGQIIVGPCLRS